MVKERLGFKEGNVTSIVRLSSSGRIALVAFLVRRIPNKDTLVSSRIKLVAMVRVNVNKGSAAKYQVWKI